MQSQEELEIRAKQEQQNDLQKLWDNIGQLLEEKYTSDANLNKFKNPGYMIVQCRSDKREFPTADIVEKALEGQRFSIISFFDYPEQIEMTTQKISKKQIIQQMKKFFASPKYDHFKICFLGHSAKNQKMRFNHFACAGFETIEVREVLECIKECQAPFFKHFLLMYEACYMETVRKLMQTEYKHVTNIDFLGSSSQQTYVQIFSRGLPSNFIFDIYQVQKIEKDFDLTKKEKKKGEEKFYNFGSLKGQFQWRTQDGEKYGSKTYIYRPSSHFHHEQVIHRYPGFLITDLRKRSQGVEESFNKLQPLLDKCHQPSRLPQLIKHFKEQRQLLISKYPEEKIYQYQKVNDNIIIFKPKKVSNLITNELINETIKGIIIFKDNSVKWIYQGFFNYQKVMDEKYKQAFDGFGHYTELCKNKDGLISYLKRIGRFSFGNIDGWNIEQYQGLQNKNFVDRISLKFTKQDKQFQISLLKYGPSAIQILVKTEQINITINLNPDDEPQQAEIYLSNGFSCKYRDYEKIKKKRDEHSTYCQIKLMKEYLRSSLKLQIGNKNFYYNSPKFGYMKTIFYKWFEPIKQSHKLAILLTSKCCYWGHKIEKSQEKHCFEQVYRSKA